MKALATTLLALALLPATALAKTGLMLDSTPDGLTAGQSWDVRFSYIRNDAVVEPVHAKVPLIRITNSKTGASKTFPARRQHNGLWASRVVFPQPGEWTYVIEGFPPTREQQEFAPVVIAPKQPAHEERVVAASTGGGSSFPWGWTIAGAAVAVVGGMVLVRRMRA